MPSLAKETKLPALHTFQVDPRVPFNRVHALLYSFAILALIYYRCVSLINSPTPLSFAAFLQLLIADLVFAFMWATAQAFRWRPVRRREFPDVLEQVVDQKEWPALDVFICTADPYKEPPMSVVNTALSVMAFDYPSDKLSVYVSDDGGSEMTLFAFMEAAKFVRYWLPFCRENGFEARRPEAYFRSNNGGESAEMKNMYQSMIERVNDAMDKGHVGVGDDLVISQEEYEIFRKWKGYTRRDHPSVIQVLLESNKDTDIKGQALPNLVYVSREKQGTIPHHFKAGALNALIRVSGVMTNAPMILTLDCDMYSTDPKAPLRALCYLLDAEMAPMLAYVQFPQRYSGINKNDIYGNEIKRVFRIHSWGLDGLSGPNYVGSNCFFSRRSFYGTPLSPQLTLEADGFAKEKAVGSIRSESVQRRARHVASCTFERGTKWGSTLGCRYGSLVEDFHTGYRLQSEGWQSVFCDPERPAFLGDVPRSLNDVLSQCKRWCVGLFETTFSRYSPLIYVTRRASLLTGLCYTHYASWGFWCIPITTYALLPQLALIYQLPLFPKVSNPWFHLHAYLFLAAYCQDLMEFVTTGGTIRQWWSDQRIWMIRGITSFLFGCTQFVLNHIGISTPRFNITSKVMEDELQERYDKGVFEFGVVSPFFISLGTVAIVNLSSFFVGIGRALRKEQASEEMFLQLFISAFVVANCWPVYEAMFLRKDGGKMPTKVTCISILLAAFLLLIAYFLLAN